MAERMTTHPTPAASGLDAGIALRTLYLGYVRLLESGRDRIRDLGGECDPVDVMERNDPLLIEIREVLEALAAQPAPGVGGDWVLVPRHEFRAMLHYTECYADKFPSSGAKETLGDYWETLLIDADSPNTTRPAESVAQGGEALFLAVASKLDHGPGELDPNATETIHTAQCRCGLFVQIATPTPATGSGGEVEREAARYRRMREMAWQNCEVSAAEFDEEVDAAMPKNPAPAGGGAGGGR